MHGSPVTKQSAFTLIELLVVIAIISLLGALLFPVFVRAREKADLAVCASKLHQLGVAASLNAADHQGFYPVAGPIRSATPSSLKDPDEERYAYYTDGNRRSALPFPAAIAPYLGVTIRSSSLAELNADLAARNGVRQFFACPSDRRSPSSLDSRPQKEQAMMWLNTSSASGPMWFYSSYNYNAGFLGEEDYGRLEGSLHRVLRPQSMMLLADGVMSDDLKYQEYWCYSRPTTLYDCWMFQNSGSSPITGPRAQTAPSFDLQRHLQNMNVLFLDGRVETTPMVPSHLQRAYLRQ